MQALTISASIKVGIDFNHAMPYAYQDKTRQDKTRQDKTRQDKTRQTNYGLLAFRKVKSSFNFSKTPRVVTTLLLIFSLILQNLIFNISPVYAASSPWTQTDWVGGSGQTSWSDTTKYSSSSSVTTSTANQVTLTATSSWYNSSWAYRKKITFNNSAQAENLTNFPVLVKLSSSNFDFTKAQSSGQDIRFTDSDGTTTLSYEIEQYSNSSSTANIWVKVPQIDLSSSTDNIYMYYGNSSATDGQAATSVWDSSYKAVWHMKDNAANTTVTESTANANTATTQQNTSVLSSTGKVGNALTFNGTTDYGSAGTTNILPTGNNPFTVTAWINPSNTLTLDGNYFMPIRLVQTTEWFAVFYYYSGNVRLWQSFRGNTQFYTTLSNYSSELKNQWNLYSFVYTGGDKNSSSSYQMYVNGSLSSITADIGTAGGSGNKNEFGRDTTSSYMSGILDEIQVSNTARSAAWIAASYKSDADTFNTYASEEPQVQSSGSLTSSIFDTEFSSGAAWGTLTYNATTPSNTSVSVKVRTSNSSSMTGVTAFGSCTAISSGSDISSNSCVTDSHRYVQYLLTLANTDSTSTPTFTSFSLTFSSYDADAPSISLTALSPDPNNDSTPTLSGTATESIGTVSNVQFQMDSTSGSWTACSASDGSFNSASEAFSCTAATLTDGSHTMYVRATDSNSNTTANASASTDSFTIDVTSPASFDLDSPGHESYTSNQRPTFKWKATTDVTSGLSSYSLEVDNGDSGDFSITGIPVSRTTDYETSKYLVHYDNFSDSDSNNNYISIYTKSSTDWTAGENYGKLKEGSKGWKILAYDNAGNKREQGRTVIVDLTSPTLSSLSVSDSPGKKDNYHITTNKTPGLTGTIADTYYPDKVEIAVYKESYYLGILTSTKLVTTRTQSLSNTSSTSLSFSAPVSQTLDYGSFYADIAGFDKAGNKSGTSTVYFKILTSQQAKELLQGKLSDKEKKTIQEHAQVSLPELEKKAILRREKEAVEFDKLTQSFSDQINYVARAFHVIPAFAGMTERIAGKTGEGIHNIATATSSVIASTSEAISKEVEIATLRLADSLRVNFLAMTNSAGKTYKNLAQGAPGVIKNTMLALEKEVNTISSIISSTNQLALNTLNKSQANLQDKVSKTSKETTNLISGLGNGTVNFISSAAKSTSDFIASVNTGLTNSQKEASKQIAQTHQSTSDFMKDKSQRISQGITLAFRSFQKPVNDTADLLDRTKIWFLTFESIVIDSDPTTISDVTVEELGKDYAIVSWKTNHYAWGKANYGKDLTYGQEVILTKREKVHTARLTGLKPGEKYYFEVMSQNKNYAYDAYYSFETKK